LPPHARRYFHAARKSRYRFRTDIRTSAWSPPELLCFYHYNPPHIGGYTGRITNLVIPSASSSSHTARGSQGMAYGVPLIESRLAMASAYGSRRASLPNSFRACRWN
jgi:hypothetical protein